jgi:hypothetical protein
MLSCDLKLKAVFFMDTDQNKVCRIRDRTTGAGRITVFSNVEPGTHRAPTGMLPNASDSTDNHGGIAAAAMLSVDNAGAGLRRSLRPRKS